MNRADGLLVVLAAVFALWAVIVLVARAARLPLRPTERSRGAA